MENQHVFIAIVAAVAYAAISLMENLIPEGKPVVVQVKLLNDPADLSPREPNLPKGPHKEDFVSNCTTCHHRRHRHSTRHFEERNLQTQSTQNNESISIITTPLNHSDMT